MATLSKKQETEIKLSNGYVIINWLGDEFFAQVTQFDNVRFVGGVKQQSFSAKTEKSILNKISKL